MSQASVAFEKLISIMNELREKCPWDRKQTIHTLRSMTIEETYELVDAIDKNDWENLKEETGDLLLHIVFYSKIAAEESKYSLEDVIEELCKKLIERHPHIYGNVTVKNEDDVKRNWENIKKEKRKSSLLSGIPAALPSLIKAIQIQEKVKQVGFEWKAKEDVFEKVKEEIAELEEAVNKNNTQSIEEEFGDVLFSLINYARYLHVDADSALEKVNKKFIARFTQMEKLAAQQNKRLTDLSLEEMDALWNDIKKEKISNW